MARTNPEPTAQSLAKLMPRTWRVTPIRLDETLAQVGHVAIVVVTYGGGASYVEPCFRALYESLGGEAHRLIFVDNRSPDDTAQYLRQAFPAASHMSNAENVGFGQAVNLACKAVEETAYILVINPDVRIDPDDLHAAISRISGDGTIGALGIRLERQDGSVDHACRRNLPSLVSALAYALHIPATLQVRAKIAPYRLPVAEYFSDSDTQAISGAFMLLRRAALEGSPPFDPRFWMYGEDLDLCRRLKARGWRVYYHGAISATHLKGMSSGQTVRVWRADQAFYYAMPRYYAKYADDRWGSLLIPASWAAATLLLLVSRIRAAIMQTYWSIGRLRRSLASRTVAAWQRRHRQRH